MTIPPHTHSVTPGSKPPASVPAVTKPPPPGGAKTSIAQPIKPMLEFGISAASISQSLGNKYYIKALLVGESKDGKTTSALSLPGQKLAIGLTPRTRAVVAGRSDVTLLEIFDDEAEAVRKGANIEYRTIPHAWDKMWNLAAELWQMYRDEKPFPFEGIVWDDLSATSKYAMNHVLGLRKKGGEEVETGLAGAPAQPHYTPYMNLLTNLFFSMLLPLPCHFVLCAHMDLYENDEAGTIAYYPRMYTKLRGEFSSWFDEAYECESKVDRQTGEQTFWWNTVGTGQKRFLGSTMNTEQLWRSPFQVDLSTSPNGFAKMLQLWTAKQAKKGGATDSKV